MKFRNPEEIASGWKWNHTNEAAAIHQPGTLAQVSDVAEMIDALRVLVEQLMQVGTDRQRAHAQPQPEHQARDGRLHKRATR